MTGRLSSLVALALLVSLPAAPAAMAQQNTLSIIQEGAGNTLSVDQSNAFGSRIEGLEIDSYSQSYQYEVDASIYDADGALIEARTATQTGSIDALRAQSGALTPSALQAGNNNTGTITASGEGGITRFLQRGNDNSAQIETGGLAVANLGQDGNANSASLSVGQGGLGTILQDGNRNDAWLDVAPGATGVISQIGNGNRTGFAVGAGTTASYSVTGSNTVTTTTPSAFSTGGAVQIIQTQGAGF